MRRTRSFSKGYLDSPTLMSGQQRNAAGGFSSLKTWTSLTSVSLNRARMQGYWYCGCASPVDSRWLSGFDRSLNVRASKRGWGALWWQRSARFASVHQGAELRRGPKSPGSKRVKPGRAPLTREVLSCGLARSGLIVPALAVGAFAPCALARGQTLFFEDFEAGDPLSEGWTVTGFPYILWHIAEDGECLAQTRRAAYNNGPAACDHNTGGSNNGRIKSPPFLVTGDPPFIVSFNHKRLVDPTGDTTCVLIVDADTGDLDSIGCVTDNSGTLQSAEMEIPNSSFWVGKNVRIEFNSNANQIGNNNPG